MMRQCLNDRDAFPKSAEEHTREVVRLLHHRRAGLDTAWAELEEGWEENYERMAGLGLRPRTSEEGMVKLNVGGSIVNLRWHLLAEAEGPGESILGALLEGVWGEGWIPRDADGRIVLDESSASTKHIIDAMLTGHSNSLAVGLPESSARSTVAVDEAPCLIYTAHVMGLPGIVPAHPTYLKINEGSTILEPFEIAPLGAKIREWVGGSVDQMALIYRATRDGFDTKAFKPTCNEDSPHTVSLIRVSSGEENGDDSVVGGYSRLAWGRGAESNTIIAAETFLFMLKDGSATRKGPSKPIKWSPYPKRVGMTFKSNKDYRGVLVGGNDLFTWLGGSTGEYVLHTGRDTFDIEEDSPFLALDGNKVIDIEVFSYSTPAPPTATALSITEPGGNVLTDAEAHDIDFFGKSIARSLMEERVVLDRAVKEMEAAGATVSAAVGALETVYGPSVAAGEHDAVVELNVRGTRMTTLRSTLQACPRSALAVMFNEERWPATGTDKDENGMRLIDCDPTCFSKALDVLRMRKRASWSRGVAGGGGQWEEGGSDTEVDEREADTEGREGKEKEEDKEKDEGSTIGGSGAVLIKGADAEAFSEAVNMYFPGCESFIMDLVQSV